MPKGSRHGVSLRWIMVICSKVDETAKARASGTSTELDGMGMERCCVPCPGYALDNMRSRLYRVQVWQMTIH